MKDKVYGKLQAKMIATTLCFSLVPLFVLGGAIYRQFSTSYTAKIMDNLKTLAENRRNAVDLFLDERTSQLCLLAYTHSFEQLTSEDRLASLFSLLQKRSRSFVDLGVIDADGTHAAYVGPYDLKGLSYEGEEWFQKAIARDVYVSDVFMGFRKAPHFIIAVTRHEGNHAWILRAAIDTDIFDDLVSTAQVGSDGDAFVINKNGVLQTPSRSAGERLSRVTGFDVSGLEGTHVEKSDVRGRLVLVGAAWLKGKDWLLVVREDSDEELLPLLRARSLALFLAAGGIVLIVLGTVLTTRIVVRQLMKSEEEKARLNASLVQAGKLAALGELAASIAHEINNPLSIIKEQIGWIKDLLAGEEIRRTADFQEIDQAVRGIDASGERARKVAHRLLDFARRTEPTQEKVDINRLIEQTIEFVGKEAQHRRINISTDCLSDLPETATDPTQVQQVFLNILNNAIDAIDKDGSIVIKTSFSSKDREIAVSFADNGPGIAQENLNKIFESFFTTKESGKGTGLGLSISCSIMDRLGGRIMVASGEGQGTIFTIYMPLLDGDRGPGSKDEEK